MVRRRTRVGCAARTELPPMNAKTVMRPSCSNPELEALIAGITEANRHEEVDFGPPQGQEEESVHTAYPTVGCAARTDV